jgi:hypothetical protein
MAFRLCTRNRLGLALAATSALTIALLTATKARAAEYVAYERDREPVTATSALALGFDAEGAVPTTTPRFLSGNTLSGGSGFKLRIGDQIHMPRLRVTPEGGYAFDHLFATDDTGTAYDWNMHRFFGGVRVAFGRVVVPGFYGHVGYGWRDTGDPTISQTGGFAYDVGFSLDIHIVPHFGFGAQAEYASIDTQPYAPQWIALGLHADLVL